VTVREEVGRAVVKTLALFLCVVLSVTAGGVGARYGKGSWQRRLCQGLAAVLLAAAVAVVTTVV